MPYTKANLVSDVIHTMLQSKVYISSKLIVEVVEIAFVSLQTALLSRGKITVPHIGDVTWVFDAEDKPVFTFTPAPDLKRRVRASIS